MARIRYLKPDFFKDEDIKELPFEARLFYQGLWVQADREGRGEDRPERLRIEIMPYDDVDAEEIIFNISSVLLFGLIGDLISTWFMNAPLLMWYMERKSKR